YRPRKSRRLRARAQRISHANCPAASSSKPAVVGVSRPWSASTNDATPGPYVPAVAAGQWPAATVATADNRAANATQVSLPYDRDTIRRRGNRPVGRRDGSGFSGDVATAGTAGFVWLSSAAS